MILSNLNSTLFGWALSNFFWYRISKTYKLYKITEIINDTIPTYHIDNLPERYNESLLKKTELTLKENKAVMKTLNLN